MRVAIDILLFLILHRRRRSGLKVSEGIIGILLLVILVDWPGAGTDFLLDGGEEGVEDQLLSFKILDYGSNLRCLLLYGDFAVGVGVDVGVDVGVSVIVRVRFVAAKGR